MISSSAPGSPSRTIMIKLSFRIRSGILWKALQTTTFNCSHISSKWPVQMNSRMRNQIYKMATLKASITTKRLSHHRTCRKRRYLTTSRMRRRAPGLNSNAQRAHRTTRRRSLPSLQRIHPVPFRPSAKDGRENAEVAQTISAVKDRSRSGRTTRRKSTALA